MLLLSRVLVCEHGGRPAKSTWIPQLLCLLTLKTLSERSASKDLLFNELPEKQMEQGIQTPCSICLQRIGNPPYDGSILQRGVAEQGTGFSAQLFGTGAAPGPPARKTFGTLSAGAGKAGKAACGSV